MPSEVEFEQRFLTELLELPPSQIPYEAGRRLEAYGQQRQLAVIGVNIWSFNFVGFAKAHPNCQLALRTDLHQQQPYEHYEIENQTLHEQHYNIWMGIHWQGHAFEYIKITWYVGEDEHRQGFLLCQKKEDGLEFIKTVCHWNEEVREEVLVFHEGWWQKNPELYESTKDITFDDVVLPPQMRKELQRDVVDFFSSEALYEQYKIPWKRGVLLYGPPGNGKTQSVKAILNTVEKPRLYVKSLQASCSQPEENIRRVFERARETAPCVLIFEDLDAIIQPEFRSFFLNELDGFAPNDGILFLATTNHAETLDPALVKRPSRFDRKYLFPLPELAERLTYITRWNNNLSEALKIDENTRQSIAEQTTGFSYAFLKELFVSCIMAWIKEENTVAMAEILQEQVVLLREQIQSLDEEDT